MKDKDSFLLANAYTAVLSNVSIKKQRIEESLSLKIEEKIPEITEAKEPVIKKTIAEAYNEAIRDINNKRTISEQNINIIASDKKYSKRLAHNMILLGRDIPSKIKEIIL